MPQRSARKKRTRAKKSRKIVGKPQEVVREEMRRKQRSRQRMRALFREHGYSPLSEATVQDQTAQNTHDEKVKWLANCRVDTSDVLDPFAVTDLTRYYPAGEPDGQCEEIIYELYGILGRASEINCYFQSPEYHRPFSRRISSGQRSDSDCFGTSLLTLANLRERVRCPIPMLGVTNVETIQSEQVDTFLAKQRGIEIFPMRTDSPWRHKWTRAKGRRALDEYLEDAKVLLKINSHPLYTLEADESFVLILGVWQAEADIAHDDERDLGHWYIVQVRRDDVFGDLRYTIHQNTDAEEGSQKLSWDEPNLFGLLTSFDVCKVAEPGSYPADVLQEYRESREDAIQSGYFDDQNYEQLFGDVDVRMELPSFISALWWAPLPLAPELRRSVTGPR